MIEIITIHLKNKKLDDFQLIVNNASYLGEKLGINQNHVSSLFTELDTDKNGLVDALELMSTLALTSGMDTIEKLHFVFSIFDFSSTGELSQEAAILMIRSVVNGRKIDISIIYYNILHNIMIIKIQ